MESKNGDIVKTNMALTGRPSSYTPETAEKIIEYLVKGRTIREICSLKAMPSVKTLFNWLEAYPTSYNCIRRLRKSKPN